MNPSKRIRLIQGVVLGSAACTWVLHPPLFGRLVPVAQAATGGDHASQDHHAGQDRHADAKQATGGRDASKTVTKYTCPMHPQIIQDHPGTCPICGMKLVPKQFPATAQSQADAVATDEHAGHEHASSSPKTRADHPQKTVTKYVGPMHPQIVQDHPGTCPICGMKLVPKQFPADQQGSAGGQAASPTTSGSKSASTQETKSQPPMPAVSVAPLTLKYMNVVTATVQRQTLARTINTVGLVGYDEDRLAHVHPRAKGWVEKLHVRSLGDPVKAGEVLLDVYSPDIVAAEKDYLVAIRNGMGSLQASAHDRLKLLNVPDSVIDTIRKTGKVQRTVPILAPQSGYIAQINLREGMYIKPSLDLYTIADRKRVWVMVDVLERDMNQVQQGDSARMTVDGLPGKVWNGKVDFVYPELDARSRTLKVRVAFKNPNGLLKPNQFANVTIDGTPRHDVLTVPTTALIPSANGTRVVRETSQGTFQPVPVHTGVSSDGRTEIVSGLSAGDKVVASGQFLIDSESNIQAAFQRMTGQVN